MSERQDRIHELSNNIWERRHQKLHTAHIILKRCILKEDIDNGTANESPGRLLIEWIRVEKKDNVIYLPYEMWARNTRTNGIFKKIKDTTLENAAKLVMFPRSICTQGFSHQYHPHTEIGVFDYTIVYYELYWGKVAKHFPVMSTSNHSRMVDISRCSVENDPKEARERIALMATEIRD